ncbi:trigger factor [Salaquimonas pukyongi]|uniref:trigger factor n=1 Tax=Salaquimonas pukyongi TaxID=2712698 RepID=UPI00096B8422|nr:trigger factor [Salaquimonas pukyongi]
MQVTETINKGLERELKIVVPKDDLAGRLAERLEDMKGKVRINGFRQGKVPLSHIKKLYGKQLMAEIVNDIVSKRSGEVLKERNEKAAQQPEVSMTEDEKEAEEILAGKQDFEFKMAYEVMPEINTPDLSKLKIERPVAEPSEKEIEEQVEQIAESARTYSEKKGKAANGDRVVMDYLGKLDGEPFEGGAEEDARLVLGSGRFIPGFEEQLVGAKAGDEKTLKIKFPDDYQATQLAGKEAEFEVKIKAVEKPEKIEINDDLAKQLGVESAEKLREAVKGQIEARNGSYTRARIKRQVLDQMDEMTKMELPQRMVQAEFDNIWNQMTTEMERAGKSFEDEDTTEEEARAEYQKLAERRVRLGLALAQIGEEAKIEVTEEEMQRAIYDQVRQYPGQEQQVFNYFRENPDAVAGLRAPLFEEKVVDHILAQADVTDKAVSAEELMKEEEE